LNVWVAAARQDWDSASDAGIRDIISLYTVGSCRQMRLSEKTSGGIMIDLVPILFEPVVISIAGGKMFVRDVQRESADDRAATFFQEWMVEPM
jgi:hypothetical protein